MSRVQRRGLGKKSLGRGLGSLFSPEGEDFHKKEVMGNSDPDLVPGKGALSSKESPGETVGEKSVASGERAGVEGFDPSSGSRDSVFLNENKGLDMKKRVWSLALDRVIPNKIQPRKDFLQEPLEGLAQSIREQGVLQPIIVCPKGDFYEIVAGERRWRASQMAGLHEIPALIKDLDGQKSMEWALIENLQREDLNPVEEARAYQLLMEEYQLSQQEVAQKVGKDRSTVTNSLRILNLDPQVLDWLQTGEIHLGHAKVLVGLEDQKEQLRWARKSLRKKFSVRTLEREIQKQKKWKNSPPHGSEPGQDSSVQNLALSLQKSLGTKTTISYKKGRGKIEIFYYSDEELSYICHKIKGTL